MDSFSDQLLSQFDCTLILQDLMQVPIKHLFSTVFFPLQCSRFSTKYLLYHVPKRIPIGIPCCSSLCNCIVRLMMPCQGSKSSGASAVVNSMCYADTLWCELQIHKRACMCRNRQEEATFSSVSSQSSFLAIAFLLNRSACRTASLGSHLLRLV